MDIKGPFKIEGKRHYALIIIDDNSRYLLFCNLYEQIKTEEVKQALKECMERYGKLERMLVDNDSRFKRKFER